MGGVGVHPIQPRRHLVFRYLYINSFLYFNSVVQLWIYFLLLRQKRGKEGKKDPRCLTCTASPVEHRLFRGEAARRLGGRMRYASPYTLGLVLNSSILILRCLLWEEGSGREAAIALHAET